MDSAAGVGGLIRAALAVERATLPPNLHFEKANPELRLARKPVLRAGHGAALANRQDVHGGPGSPRSASAAPTPTWCSRKRRRHRPPPSAGRASCCCSRPARRPRATPAGRQAGRAISKARRRCTAQSGWPTSPPPCTAAGATSRTAWLWSPATAKRRWPSCATRPPGLPRPGRRSAAGRLPLPRPGRAVRRHGPRALRKRAALPRASSTACAEVLRPPRPRPAAAAARPRRRPGGGPGRAAVDRASPSRPSSRSSGRWPAFGFRGASCRTT